ncbi:MAG TPA: hypothetical protein DDW52_03915 [Planctomycetaceae bacterium]|nr:hypothetical protein [Planctomycetaceae bacterium]
MLSFRNRPLPQAVGLSLAFVIFWLPLKSVSASSQRTNELDVYWAAAAETVRSGDFEEYRKTFHRDAVLVSEIAGTSYPIAKAFERWKEGFEETKRGKLKANVEFRFSKRIGDSVTAHETGIFHYSTTDSNGKATSVYIHFQALLVKKDGRWQAVMELHKTEATQQEWQALKNDKADSP